MQLLIDRLINWGGVRGGVEVQYIPRNMHTVFALLCFVMVIHWLIFPYPSGLLHWHCGNLTIAPVPAKQPWWIWINTSCEFIMNDCITTTKQSTTKPCAYFLGYTVPGSCVGVTDTCLMKCVFILCWIHSSSNFYQFVFARTLFGTLPMCQELGGIESTMMASTRF